METPLRLLWLEQDDADQRAFLGLVRDKGLAYKVACASTLAEARARVAESRFDLIVADCRLPDGEAMELFEEVRDIPLILLAGAGEEQLALDALERGAADYLPKRLGGQCLATLPCAIEKTLHRKRVHEAMRKSEEAVRESELFHRTLVETLPVTVVLADPRGKITYISPAAKQMFGLEPGEGLGTLPTDWIAPEYHEIVYQRMRKVLIELQPQLPVEYKMFRRDRTLIWASVASAPLLDAGGRLKGVITVCQDITEMKRAQAAVQESEQRLALAASGARVGIFDWNTVTGDRHWTPEHEAIFGYAPASATTTTTIHSYRDWADRVHPDDLPRVVQEAQRCLIEGRAYETEYRVVWPDGSVHWIEARGRPVADAEGRPARMMGTVMDITDRKWAEEELQAAKNSAEVAKAAAEQASRAKDRFLAVLSHELRTPLTPVVMGVAMLQDRSGLEPAVCETLEMVRRNVEMEARLIDDLLDVSRIAQGKIELHKSLVELCAVIQQAVQVCQPDLEARRLQFGVDLGPAAPYWIEADASRLQQVFWNLLENAIKFTPHGGCVRIYCRPDAKHVVVEVKDSGIGMEPEALTRVFNAFEQGERSITRQFGGLGLGLAICKALVEMHGGTIEAESQGRNQGATFRIRLPLAAPAGAPEAPAPAAPGKHVVRALRILLVEDHGVTAKMMKMVLAAEGHAVETAGDVATALELADRGGFDLLMADLGLPDGNGHDLMRQLRQLGCRFPGIALSGYGQEEDVRRSYEAGFSAHLIKPASREAVLQAVAAAVGEEPASGEPPP